MQVAESVKHGPIRKRFVFSICREKAILIDFLFGYSGSKVFWRIGSCKFF